MAQFDDDGNLIPFFLSGLILKRNMTASQPLKLQETEYAGLYQICLLYTSLSDMAISDAEGFAKLAELAKAKLS